MHIWDMNSHFGDASPPLASAAVTAALKAVYRPSPRPPLDPCPDAEADIFESPRWCASMAQKDGSFQFGTQQLVNSLFQGQPMRRPDDDPVQARTISWHLSGEHDDRSRGRTQFDDVRHFDPCHSCHDVFGYHDVMHLGIKENKSLLRASRHIDRKPEVGQEPFAGETVPVFVTNQEDSREGRREWTGHRRGRLTYAHRRSQNERPSPWGP